MYALKPNTSSPVPAYVVSLAISYWRPNHNSWVGDLSFVALVLRILNQKHTHASLIWQINQVSFTSPISLRAHSLNIYWQIYQQCRIAQQLWVPPAASAQRNHDERGDTPVQISRATTKPMTSSPKRVEVSEQR